MAEGLGKARAVTLIHAGALLAIESLDAILAKEGHARAKMAFDYSQVALDAIQEQGPQITFDVCLAYAEGVTMEQLEFWLPDLKAEGLPSHHVEAAIQALKTTSADGAAKEEG